MAAHLTFLIDFAGMRHDASLSLPIRQTASIFKQPVTVVRNHPDSTTKSDIKHGPQDPPRQVCYWFRPFQCFSMLSVRGRVGFWPKFQEKKIICFLIGKNVT